MNAIIRWRSRFGMPFALVVFIMFIVGAHPIADDEIEAHLNSLNKHAIKSLELEDGETVDCIDIYKQPAFDNPLLKDHKIIMSPSFPMKTAGMSNKSRQQPVLQSAWQKSEGCPEGTIPIRRVHKSDLLRASSLKDFGRKVVSGGQVERAGKTLYNDGPYIGTKACLNIWEVPVEPNEWSQVSIEVSDGHDRDNNKIVLEVGWVVNPQLFGNNKTHTYTYWTTDGYNSTGCYNLLCAGFVQTSKSYVFGQIGHEHISTYEGEQFCLETSIYMDASNSVWWLAMGDSAVGYWPMCLFKRHRGGVAFEGASTMRWIGSVLNTKKGGKHTTTDMGSGHYAEDGWRKAANIEDIQVMKDVNDGYYQPSTELAIGFADDASCYDFYVEDSDFLFFGGPGRGPSCS